MVIFFGDFGGLFSAFAGRFQVAMRALGFEPKKEDGRDSESPDPRVAGRYPLHYRSLGT